MRALASIPLLLGATAVRAALAGLLLVVHGAAAGEPPANRGTWIAWAADDTLVRVLLGAMVLEALGHVGLVWWARRRLRRGDA